MTYPTKTVQLGDFVWLQHQINDDTVQEAKEVLQMQIDYMKETYECDGDKVFCHFGEPEWIIKDANSGLDPLSSRGTVGWKLYVTGRAFYIHKTFRAKDRIERHANKKRVPKRKRGKRMLTCLK